jgi:glycosyltransferase involved in cell wall biosynthesis
MELAVLGNAVTLPPERAVGGAGVLYLGRLAPKKAVGDLIRAAAIADVPVTIVGDGPERARLEALADAADVDARFVGAVAPDAVDRWYRRADMCVQPSVAGEGLPNVVLEAMAWGLPVIATDSGGLDSLVIDGETGLRVPMRDPAAIAAAIERLRADDALRASLGAAARAHVAANHGWEQHLDRLEAMYDRVISAG